MSHQIHSNSKRKSGKHLSYSERQYIERIYTQNQKQARKNRLTQKEMAALIGISEATLSRELKRGAVTQLDTELIPYTSYAALVAQQDYDYKASNKGPGLKIGDDHELAQTLERHLLGEDEDGQVSQIGNKVIRYSPDAVIMKLNEEGWPTETRICTRTLYNYIESDLFLRVTCKDLPRGGQPKKSRERHVRRSYKVPTGRQIEDRPLGAEDRNEYGHWEMDCIESVKQDKTCILSLVERKSRTVLLYKIKDQTQASVIQVLDRLERRLGSPTFRRCFKSITVDNGSEFWDWNGLEQSIQSQQRRTEIYYAHPYSSWERGSNENMNGFVRYYIPKGSVLKTYTQKAIKQLACWINQYPRRIHQGKSAARLIEEALAA